MRRPAPATVRGDFNNAQFSTDRQTTRFFRKDGDYWLRTTDTDGVSREYAIAYTFGWAPLQQYLLDTGNGRLQAYNIAWDTQKQQWFDLYADEPPAAGAPLHWRGPAQNANFMCIECHSSAFTRNYDADNSRFDSHWRALGVSCQSCHGPASKHLDWARHKPRTAAGPGVGFEQPLTDAARRHEVSTCARCHSRRTPLADGFDPHQKLRDNYRVSGLAPGLYEVDGTIAGEVFEYGAFAQSRMAAAGVVCSDCHNPHSGELRAEGNAVCTGCHQPGGQASRATIDVEHLPTGDFDSPAHHHHRADSPGARCVACHMPGRIYMGVDLRHDHGFTTPNPVQARALEHGDACLDCHQDAPPDEIIGHYRRWYPQAAARDRGFATAQFKARHGEPGAAAALFRQLARTDLPALRRAALLAYLPSYPSGRARQALLSALRSEAPAVREAALALIPRLLSPAAAANALKPLLQDPVKSVRISAAWQLLQVIAPGGQPASEPTSKSTWIAEYEQVQKTRLSRASTRLNLANLYQLTGRHAKVAPQLHAALKLDPDFILATLMLAQWLEQAEGRVEQARALLDDALARHPRDARLHQALGLLRVRTGAYPGALRALEQAHRLAPDNADYAYVLAVALRDTGAPQQARQLLRRQVAAQPADRAARLLLVDLLRADAEPHQDEIQSLLDGLRHRGTRHCLAGRVRVPTLALIHPICDKASKAGEIR